MSDTIKRTLNLSAKKKELLKKLTQQQGLSSTVPVAPLVPILRQDGELFPLSFAQQRLWILEQINPNTPLYNVPLALRLSGNIDLAALNYALSEVVRRHEALRTAFVERAGVPFQKIAQVTNLPLPLIDLRSLHAEQREQEVLRYAAEEAERPFDLTEGLLLRTLLLQLAENEYVFLLTMHHIASDAWSVEVLYEEILVHYQAYEEGRPSPLPELTVQYVDYALWQRQWLQGELLEHQLGYWKKQLAALPAFLPLPTNRPRPAVQTFRGASYAFCLSPRLTINLKTLSQREGSTLFMTVLAAFQVWLCRHTAQDDISVGTPIANRSHAELEPLIGFFLNTLVLRTDLSGNPSFRDLLQRVREVTLDAFNYRDVPFELVVEALQPERNLSYAPLFQVLFTLQNMSAPSSNQSADFLSQPLEVENTVAKCDLSLGMTEREQDGEPVLTGEFEYNCDLFDAATIARFAQRFITLLEEIVRQPEQCIQDLNLLPVSEREQVMEAWQTLTAEPLQEICLHQLFEAQVARTPKIPALVFEDEQLNYEELNSKANQLASYLQQLGVRPEVCVGVCMERSLEMLIALLGILKAGGAYVPLDPTVPQKRRDFILAEVQAPVLLTQQHLFPTLAETSITVICLDTGWEPISHEPTNNLACAASAQHMAYVIYTSGSTGQPKGVVIRHSSVVNLAAGLNQTVYTHAQEGPLRVSLNAALTFDASVQQITQLAYGHTLYIIPQEIRSDTIALLAYLKRHALQVLDCTPGQLHQLLLDELRENAAPALSHVLIGGEAIDAALWQTLAQDSTRAYYNLYGPTECTVDATVCGIHTVLDEPTIGRPLAHVEVYVLDAFLQPTPIGVPGELYIGGDGLARGYLNRPDFTAERFVPHPYSYQAGARLYRTGDRVCWLADGNLEYLGRLDHQVKIRGFRIELGEIEQRLLQHPDVDACVVVARQDLVGAGQSLVAYLVPTGEADLLSKDLRVFLQQHLPDYMVPTFFEILAALPRTSNGKVDRQALPAPHMERSKMYQHGPLPRNPLEEAVAEIWQQVLGQVQLGIREQFFEIGGHSLLAMQVISRIRAVFQIELPLRRLFETPTIEGLAQVIAQVRQEEPPLLEPPILPAPRDSSGAIPISFAQQRLWILDRLNPGSTTYHIPLTLRFSGSLHREALERSLCEIVTRHAVLRTSFPILHDTPVQAISPAVEAAALPFTDLKHLLIDERLPTLLDLIAEERQKPFDLANGPLFRTHLIGVAEDEHVLLLTMHHIVSDGWSMGILIRELSALYLAFSTGQTSPLPALSLQYADYAIWQRAWLQGAVLDRQLSYWRTQLAGVPALLSLPTDRPRSAIQSARGASYSFVIAPTLTSELQQLGQHAGATLFMTLLAAFQVFLSRYCNQEDIVVGTPIANRTHQEIENLIGFFVNTLVLRTDLSRNPTFLEVMQRVRHVVLDAITYQDIPFEQIVEALQPERDLGRSPFFQVMFLLQNASQEQFDLTSLTVSEVEIEQSSAKFDLTLALTQSEQGLEGEFEYNTDLFEVETIARMAEHFQVLLTALVQAPTQPITTLPLLSQEQYQQIVLDWNATERAYTHEHLVYELIEEQALLRPEAPALSSRGLKLTYGELNSKANRLAHYLQAQGVGPGSVVGIYLPRNLEMVIALYATLKTGAAYLQLDPATPPSRTALILQEAQVVLLVTQESLVTRLAQCEVPLLNLDQMGEHLSTQPDENLPRSITPEYPVYIIYTSGSTGKPKGVVVQHKSLVQMIFWYHETFEVTADDKATQLASLSFDATVFEIWPCLTKGVELYLVEEEVRISPTALIPWLVKHGITICYLPTALVDLMVNRAWPAQGQLRLMLTGGDQLHHLPTKEAKFTLINMYGPTENTVVATWAAIPPGQEEERLPVIGRAIANTQVYVLNQAGEPQPIGVPGELFLGGQSLAQGYLDRPDLTAASFMPDPFSGRSGARLYKTGDIARYQADGNLEFLGRRDHQVKIRGFRIELGEIETLLMGYPGVHEAIVVVSENIPGEKRLGAYVVPQAGVTLTKEKLQRFLKERLPDYMVPTALSLLEELPQTSHGKVDRQALASRRLITHSSSEQYIAPRDAIELQLAHLWEKLLGINPISVTENFFQLGGHSLTGVRLMSQIQRLFGLELPLSMLFQEATIASLATVLRQQEAQMIFTPLVAIQPDGSRPPLFCVHPSGGEVLCYMNLARHLGSDQPVYGLRASDLQLQEAGTSLIEMASAYREALCTIQPYGPYFLGGWSMGGVIAFEMARQLEAQGQHVAFLGLFDSYLPPEQTDDDEHTWLRKFVGDLADFSGMTFSYTEAGIPVAETEEALQYLLLEVQQAHLLPTDVDVNYIKRLFSTFKRNVDALCRYQPEFYAGEISLFQASAFTGGDQVELTYGWHQFAAQVTQQAVPGNHYTMLRDPQVEVLARLINACLAKHNERDFSGYIL
ncbi:MAG: amino acid adenylation domain-containing protein [Ktedonobacteraceae bacterium]